MDEADGSDRKAVEPKAEFNRWTVVEFSHLDGRRRRFWTCRCRCGTVRPVHESDLRANKTRSCGCHKSEATAARNTTHGMRHSPEWNVWNRMVQRCTNPRNPDFPDYGGRGITVDPAWVTFEGFFASMGQRPSKDHTLEREKVNGPYSPDNCVWLVRSRQAANTRRTRLLTIDGREQNLSDWSRETGVSVPTILARIKLGWDVKRAVTEQARRHNWREADATLTKERKAWSGMKYRCSDPTNPDYHGKGVKVHPAWESSFDAFLSDVGPAPSSKHSLERKENAGDYVPGNVVWATRTAQNRNRSTARLLTLNGVTRGLSEWAELTGIPAGVIRLRLDKHKWPVGRALTEPPRGASG
jgi:hypothetical protein